MITFTKNALKKLKSAVDPGDYVRVGVVGGGCAGLSYTIEIDDKKNTDDLLLDVTKDIIVCMNPYSNFTLKNVVVDYVESLHQSGFKFDNPDAQKACACGTSFKPAADASSPPPGGCSTGGCSV